MGPSHETHTFFFIIKEKLPYSIILLGVVSVTQNTEQWDERKGGKASGREVKGNSLENTLTLNVWYSQVQSEHRGVCTDVHT